ncbi:GumC family protein [Synoicihabitans lomoniglobus]|uniref:Polysaccharide biosynthesis tyrosine autokinase n=1 Tax=Synoicihabitans lomoniglobus TaxID=2909285 RepID=A0AAE9ZS49_9BACT|nr:polysaccharide biosynthesis tyrosine autokinase [Opitutaceae bacterium LMO-M01]WED63192.1 polysaccharide biosynthesis tyrosine autokinase [Opitutaceae bacterium LMO-M01]
MAAPLSRQDHTTLADFLRILRQRKAMVAGLTLIVLATAAVVTMLLPKWYLSTAQVRVEKPDGAVKLFQNQGSAAYDPYFLQDQFKIMQSPKILYPVIEHLDLNREIGLMLDSPEALPIDITLGYLVNEMLQLESPRNSSFIDINVYAQRPQLAADIANEIARVYSEDRIAFATSEQREGLSKLRNELEIQEREVTAQRDRVEQLRNDLNLAGVDLNARYSDMEIETLRQMQNSLIALRVDAIGRKTRWERFRDIPFEERVNLVNSELISDANIQDLLQAYLVTDQTETRLRARLGSAHPDLVAAVENRLKIREQLDGQLRGYEKALEIAYQEASSRVAELERQLSAAKVEQILSARDRVRPFEEAAQDLEDSTRLLTTLKLTLRQREIDFQVPKRTIELLGEARPARRASKPSWTVNLVLALTVGLLLGIGVAVAIEYFDTSFRNVADIETRLQVPVVGVIPWLADAAAFDPDDMVATEPFRVLQTNLNLALPQADSIALSIVSAGPGEGKSTTVHRLALVMARSGQKVLLVDADLRRPTQHRLGGWKREPGLADYLKGDASLDDVIQVGAAPELDVIGSGGVTDFTLGMLHTRRLQELITETRGRYDRILFDSPPIIGVSDASVLSTTMDGALLLIQHRRNPQAMTIRAQQTLASAHTTLFGAILNQVPADSGEDYGYYAHNYAYYGESNRRRAKSRSSRPAVDKTADGGPERIDLDEPGR